MEAPPRNKAVTVVIAYESTLLARARVRPCVSVAGGWVCAVRAADWRKLREANPASCGCLAGVGFVNRQDAQTRCELISCVRC